MKNKRTFIILIVLLVVIFCLCILFGSVFIPISELLPSLFKEDSTYGIIVRNLRLPRVIGCVLSGVALSTSGFLLQRITSNELASPNVIGVNAGAGFAVMILLCFLPKCTYLISLFAFLGALTATFIVILISRLVKTHMTSVTLILSGVAISSLLNAGISFLSQLYPDVLSSYVLFSSGGFSSVRWKDLLIPAILIIISFIVCLFLSGRLNLLLLGDDLASSLGVSVKNLKLICLILASLMTGASVSYAGLLGFVGLLVPHIASKLVGNDARTLLPCSAIMGAILVLLSDLLGRTVFSPSEVSAGILLAFIGAPFFVYLLFRKGGKHVS